MDFATLMDSQSGIVALGMAAVSGVCAFICAFMPAPTEQSGMLYRIVYELLKDKLNIAKITFTSGVNAASQEYETNKEMDRCPLCGIALDENGVCPKCGYRK